MVDHHVHTSAVGQLNQLYDVRSRHYTVLVVAAEGPGRSQRELSELLGQDPSAVVSIVDDLAHAGLVRREPSPDDRRTKLVAATARGRTWLEEAIRLAREVDTALQASLTAEEREQLLRLLRRVATD
jgi:MarR family transcriptional regulator, lower aerobic nicotinate degradation pathway regulator